MVCSVDKIADL